MPDVQKGKSNIPKVSPFFPSPGTGKRERTGNPGLCWSRVSQNMERKHGEGRTETMQEARLDGFKVALSFG